MKSLCLLVLLGGTAAAQPGATDPPPQPYPAPQPQPPPQTYPAPQTYPPPQTYPAPQPYPPPQPYARPQYAQPQPPPQHPAPGGSRATFMSTTEKRWDVRIDTNAVCTTPCSMYVEPGRFVTMHSQDLRPTKLSVGYIPPGDFIVNAKPRSEGAFATAVTFTSLGGAAVVTGISLTAVGCNTDNRVMCRAGIITGLAGGGALAVFIPMIGRAMPRASIGPATGQPYVNGQTAGLAGSF
jgi:hypothetical protein